MQRRIRMDQLLANSKEESRYNISKNTRLEGIKKMPISDISESSISLKSNMYDHEKYHLGTKECFSKLTDSEENERSHQLEKFKNFKEIITRNYEKEKNIGNFKSIEKSKIEMINIKNFFKVIKKPEATSQTFVNDKNSKKNYKKRNWDSSSEDDSLERDFLPKTHKKIKFQSPKQNCGGDIRKIFEKLQKSNINQNSTLKKAEESSKISNISEEKQKHAKYYKQKNKLEIRNNSNTNQKQPLRKCQSLQSSFHNKVELQINSMPLTEKECKAAERKVRDEKITFNEFVAKVLKNMHRKNELQTKSTNLEENSEMTRNTSRSDEVTESGERPEEKTILDIIKSLKQNKIGLQEDLHSKEIGPQKVCLEDISVNDKLQIYSPMEILESRNGNGMCGLNSNPKNVSNRGCPKKKPVTNSRQCNKYDCQIPDDSTQAGNERTIYNVLEMLRKHKDIDERQKTSGLLESDKIDGLNNVSKKQIEISSSPTTTRLKLVETATIVDSTKAADSSLNSIHTPDNSLLIILKDKFQGSISKCESESEKSVDFAMYFPSQFTNKSAIEIKEPYNVPSLYSSNNISKSLHQNPNLSDNITSQIKMDYKCKDLPTYLQATDSTSALEISLKRVDSLKIGPNKSSSDRLPSEILPKGSVSMTPYKVPNASLLREILNVDESVDIYDERVKTVPEAEKSQPINCNDNFSTDGISMGTTQNDQYNNQSYTHPKKDTKMPISKDSCDNLLDDDLVKTILTENYEKFKRRKEIEVDKRENKFNGLLENLIQKISRDAQNDQQTIKGSQKCYPKRYKKGKLRIFRLKKFKKMQKSSDSKKENLNFDELFKKITQDFIEPHPLSRSKSGSTISTTSSYITDDTRSETLSTGSKELPDPQQKLRMGLNKISKDKSLYCEEEQMYFTEYNKDEIKMKIQNIFLRVFDDLTNGRKAVLKLRRQSFGNCIFKSGRLQFKPADELMMSVISADVSRSKAKFKLIIYILKKIQTLLETNTKLTKRELFYQLKSLIGDQRVTDRAINTISCLLDVGMWALNIVAQKGLVFGNLKLLLSSGETLNCNVPGTMIPQDIGEIIEIQSSAYFILVVEKESIFHKLIEEDLPNKLTRSFIMITGKGFPDLNTQLFLRKLWVVMSIPIFILVDADPHGINIMLNYRFGSVNNAHVSHHLAVPKAKWLGVFPSEIGTMNITKQTLSERELKLAEDLLKTPYMAENPRIVKELKVLIEKKFKAGIEGLIKSNVFLSEVYLPTKFYNHNFI